MRKKLYTITIISLFVGCSDNKEPVSVHFSKQEMAELNKTGKITKVDNNGIENTYYYDDRYKKNQDDLNKSKNKISDAKRRDPEKEKAAKEKAKRLAAEKAAAEVAKAKRLAAENEAAEVA